MWLCAITDRRLLKTGNFREELRGLAAKWAAGGVDFIQIREKDLGPDELFELTTEITTAVREAGPTGKARVLLNCPERQTIEIARSARADGVHIPGGLGAGELKAQVQWARSVFSPRIPLVSTSCHSVAEIAAARTANADLALFGAVFEKQGLPGQGLAALSRACWAAKEGSETSPIRILALGGIDPENAASVAEAGADGIAGIRIFLGEEWRRLR